VLILESNDRFDDIAELDTATGRITWYSRRKHREIDTTAIDGHIAVVDGYPVCLYRLDGELNLRIGAVTVELMDDASVRLTGEGIRVLSIRRRGVECCKWSYARPVIDPPLSKDTTFGVEEEHFDFGLFVRNVMADPARRERMYRRSLPSER